MVYTVVGESHAHAEEREELFLHSLVDPQASLTLLSELMNYDFSGLALDAPITDELIGSVSGIRGLVQNLRDAHRRGHRHAGRSGRPPGHPAPGPAVRRHGARRGRPDGGVDRRPTPATGSSSRPPTPRAPTRTWSGWSSPSSSAAASSATATPVRTLPRHLGHRPPGCGAAMTESPGPSRGCASSTRRRWPPGRWWPRLGEFGADVIKVEQPGSG